MTISMKNYHGGDIAAAMAKTLSDEKFVNLYKKAFVKEATEPMLTKEYVKYLFDQCKTENELAQKWNTLLSQIEKVENVQPGFLDYCVEVREQKMTELKSALADDMDKQEGESLERLKRLVPQEDAKKEEVQLAIAMDFAVKQLNKLANALDSVGFPGVAEYIDVTAGTLYVKRPKIALASKKKKDKPMTFKDWSTFLKEEDKEALKTFQGMYKDLLKTFKKEKMEKEEALEEALKQSVKKLPRKLQKGPKK